MNPPAVAGDLPVWQFYMNSGFGKPVPHGTLGPPYWPNACPYAADMQLRAAADYETQPLLWVFGRAGNFPRGAFAYC